MPRFRLPERGDNSRRGTVSPLTTTGVSSVSKKEAAGSRPRVQPVHAIPTLRVLPVRVWSEKITFLQGPVFNPALRDGALRLLHYNVGCQCLV